MMGTRFHDLLLRMNLALARQHSLRKPTYFSAFQTSLEYQRKSNLDFLACARKWLAQEGY